MYLSNYNIILDPTANQLIMSNRKPTGSIWYPQPRWNIDVADPVNYE